ncbi:hypothetical protein WEH80_26770 [Actinomycetes bacterium KLBMP 9759]
MAVGLGDRGRSRSLFRSVGLHRSEDSTRVHRIGGGVITGWSTAVRSW